MICALRPAGTVVRERIRVAGAGAHVSAVTVMELRYGIARSTNPTRNAVATSQMLARLRVIDFDADLVTHNTREFARVPGLTAVDWAS